MIFRKKYDVAARIGLEIEEERNRPSSPENFNYIGDLSLRKGDRIRTVEYYYMAIAMLHISQREKIMAIYKKIINLAPADEKAYEGLAGMLARMGLVADEVKYLTVLAGLYQSKGNYDKLNSTFRRIHEIDPRNRVAAKYFGKGKQETAVMPGMNRSAGREKTLDVSAEAEPERIPPKNGPDVEEETKLSVAWEAEDSPVVYPEEFERERISHKAFSVRHGRKMVYLFTGIAVLLIGLAASVFLFGGKKEKAFPGQAAAGKKTWYGLIAQTKELKTGNFEVSVEGLLDEAMVESGLKTIADQKGLKENRFYAVTIKAVKGCLPEAVVKRPDSAFYFTDSSGRLEKIDIMKGLHAHDRIIYRTGVSGCGGDAAVFMKTFV